eukprot:3665087-Pyramimonas_sp.AAC.1
MSRVLRAACVARARRLSPKRRRGRASLVTNRGEKRVLSRASRPRGALVTCAALHSARARRTSAPTFASSAWARCSSASCPPRQRPVSAPSAPRQRAVSKRLDTKIEYSQTLGTGSETDPPRQGLLFLPPEDTRSGVFVPGALRSVRRYSTIIPDCESGEWCA